MKTQANFRTYNPDQLMLMPLDLAQWLPQDHLVYFIRDVVGQLDLSGVYASYDGSKGGYPAYHPEMMVVLLLYAYCVGMASSRQIEKACEEAIPFRVLTANQHPDHDTVAEFRRRHLKALAALFIQVLHLCQKAGLVKLGHIALDGTKVKANASKHTAMSYSRMQKNVAELEAEVECLLQEAEAEDQRYGKGRRGDELPEGLRFKKTRLAKIKETKEALEQEARGRAEQEEKEQKQNHRGRPPKPPVKGPDSKVQRNFTDPDSRIMKDSATKSFAQAYNCQVAVDSQTQVIVALQVTQQANDRAQVKPLIKQLVSNIDEKPKQLSADNGYYSEENVGYLVEEGIEAFIATGRLKHTEEIPCVPRGRIPAMATVKDRMARKLRTVKGREIYSRRKGIVEPVFGQIKNVRRFRQFLLRGMEKVSAEWDLICLGHNLLKLFRNAWAAAIV